VTTLIRGTQSAKVGRYRLLPLVTAVVLVGVFMFAAVGCTPQQAMEMNLGLGLNKMRADNGLPPLTVDPSLSVVARERAEDMAAKDYFSHSPPDGCDFRCLFSKSNVSMAWTGEVIAWNTYLPENTIQATLQMWHDSPGHFSVITNRCFTRMGVGVATAPDRRIYHVAVFEGRAPGC
jgi:Cysteine-rich secretory protein family